ncbi:MAG: type II toxin-antitoxin system RelE/ParE family toxin [Pseudomonadota bacterium]
MTSLVVRPAAAADVEDAYLWYEAQRRGLGEEFLSEVDRIVLSIVENPPRYSIIHRETRRALLRRFPYAVFYRVLDDTVVIVAVMHGSRDPRRWHGRT